MRNPALIVSFGLLALSTPAFAQEGPPQPRCGKFEEARAGLAKGYGEVPTYAGQTPDGGHVIVVFVNPESRSFTIMTLRPDGLSCATAAGEGFHQLPPMPVKPEEKGS